MEKVTKRRSGFAIKLKKKIERIEQFGEEIG